MRYRLKVRLAELRKSQVWLINMLREKGISVQPPELSSFISGAVTTPKAELVLQVADEILCDEERMAG